MRRSEIVALLRERIERALTTRALIRGDRLPSTRELASEFGADQRVVSAAYKVLALEGVVEIRARSGVYVSGQTLESRDNTAERGWLADVLTEGVMRGLSTRDLCDDLRESALSRKIRAVVIAGTRDQTAGMARELRTDYGIEVTEVLAEALRNVAQLPRVVRQTHLLVTTKRFGKSVSAIARRLGKPSIVASIRPSLFGGDLLSLMQREVFLIARDPPFLTLLREYLKPIPGGNNVTMLVAGRDSLARISPDSPTYVTQAAREILGTTRIPGRLIPPARVFAADCVREIVGVIVALNAGA